MFIIYILSENSEKSERFCFCFTFFAITLVFVAALCCFLFYVEELEPSISFAKAIRERSKLFPKKGSKFWLPTHIWNEINCLSNDTNLTNPVLHTRVSFVHCFLMLRNHCHSRKWWYLKWYKEFTLIWLFQNFLFLCVKKKVTYKRLVSSKEVYRKNTIYCI